MQIMETEILAGLIDKKYEVLSSLRQLARAQVNVVRDGDMTRLMKLLATKQDLLHQLQNVEREIDPFREQDPESRRWCSPQRRQQVRDMTTRCESLLNEIMLVERQCENELVVRRAAAATRLQGIQSVTHATDAYLSNGPALSQLDLSSGT
jgi:flagellar biosynthesis/type III secretory pathway chaperone